MTRTWWAALAAAWLLGCGGSIADISEVDTTEEDADPLEADDLVGADPDAQALEAPLPPDLEARLQVEDAEADPETKAELGIGGSAEARAASRRVAGLSLSPVGLWAPIEASSYKPFNVDGRYSFNGVNKNSDSLVFTATIHRGSNGPHAHVFYELFPNANYDVCPRQTHLTIVPVTTIKDSASRIWLKLKPARVRPPAWVKEVLRNKKKSKRTQYTGKCICKRCDGPETIESATVSGAPHDHAACTSAKKLACTKCDPSCKTRMQHPDPCRTR